MSDENIKITVQGRVIRTARLRFEYFESLEDPPGFLDHLKNSTKKADIFTFLQSVADTEPKFDFKTTTDSLAVVRISTYEQWWKEQISDKTRNAVRRSQKAGIQVRLAEFNDDLIKGIKEIYDESPWRQDKPFIHYGKDLETLKEGHVSFIDRSEFFGAYDGNDLVGFIKLVHSGGFSSLMQIISKISSRNKAPTNALIAKAVEVCAQKGIPYLMYGSWSRHGLGEFKKHHAFVRHEVPRYYVPLTTKGRIALLLGLHLSLKKRIPESWLDFGIRFRKKWRSRRTKQAKG
jgi:hypothetical protein